LAIVTHPKIFDPPTPMPDALRTVSQWVASPLLTLLSEAEGYEAILPDVLTKALVVGPRVHDARVAALCLQHGVSELWTADRDFSRFPELSTRNPLRNC
jgi:predicted nucleic acid-binding protein